MTTNATEIDFPVIALLAVGQVCFKVWFEGPEAEYMACDFIDRKVRETNGSVSWFQPVSVDGQYTKVWERMSCEHGMSYELCEGPQHYAYDEDERAFYGV